MVICASICRCWQSEAMMGIGLLLGFKGGTAAAQGHWNC